MQRDGNFIIIFHHNYIFPSRIIWCMLLNTLLINTIKLTEKISCACQFFPSPGQLPLRNAIAAGLDYPLDWIPISF